MDVNSLAIVGFLLHVLTNLVNPVNHGPGRISCEVVGLSGLYSVPKDQICGCPPDQVSITGGDDFMCMAMTLACELCKKPGEPECPDAVDGVCSDINEIVIQCGTKAQCLQVDDACPARDQVICKGKCMNKAELCERDCAAHCHDQPTAEGTLFECDRENHYPKHLCASNCLDGITCGLDDASACFPEANLTEKCKNCNGGNDKTCTESALSKCAEGQYKLYCSGFVDANPVYCMDVGITANCATYCTDSQYYCGKDYGHRCIARTVISDACLQVIAPITTNSNANYFRTLIGVGAAFLALPALLALIAGLGSLAFLMKRQRTVRRVRVVPVPVRPTYFPTTYY